MKLIKLIRQLKNDKTKRFKSEKIYGKGNSGNKIADILSRVKVNIQKKLHYMNK